MAGNYCHGLNSNPFNTGVQLHRTPPHNAGVADEQQPSIFTTQAQARCAGSDNPLRLGGYLPAPAMTFPGERSQQTSILAPQVQALPNPFCLFSILSTSGTHVRQAESDQLNENSIF